jgi:serpin B
MGGFSDNYDLEKVSDGFAAANNGFAFDIFKKLYAEDAGENVFISPFSISTALSMTYNGAQSTTKQAMAETLGYDGLTLEAVNDSYKNIISYLHNADKKISLEVANSIWIREGEKIKEDFISRNMEFFNAEVDMLDFSQASAVDRINRWISDATNKKIDKMLESPIPADVVMYLINAIYFKGEWSSRFKPEQTSDGRFTTAGGEKKNVKMMSKMEETEYLDTGEYRAVRLPYGNGKTAMYCVLPNEGTDINEFIGGMDVQEWNRIRQEVSKTDDVVLQIPRFKIEYGIKELNDSLIALGMEEEFSANADFSGIRPGLFISRVLHKAVIEVNEKGSEAAGVTVVEKAEGAAMQPPTFIADRPFLFMISEEETGSILFMGILADPY